MKDDLVFLQKKTLVKRNAFGGYRITKTEGKEGLQVG